MTTSLNIFSVISVISAPLFLWGCEKVDEASTGGNANSVEIVFRTVIRDFDPNLDAALPTDPDEFIGECNSLKNFMSLNAVLNETNVIDEISPDNISVGVQMGSKVNCTYTANVFRPSGENGFGAHISGSPDVAEWDSICDFIVLPVENEMQTDGRWVHFQHDRFITPAGHSNCCSLQGSADIPGPPGFPPNCN